MKLSPNVSYNCNCSKLKDDITNDIPNIILNSPKKRSTQIITFYKSKNKKEKNKTLF